MAREPLRYNVPIVDGRGMPTDYLTRLWQTNVLAQGQMAYRTITATGEATVADNLILVDASAAAVTVNLPVAAESGGALIKVKKVDASANAVTLDANGSETIDGATTQVISAQYDALSVECDGTGWWIV
jgi:hypothetical protein